ncbi:MAG: DNA primase [Lentisphaeria bacterium]|nr:DNA primase [Lentisphaeria bacterium]
MSLDLNKEIIEEIRRRCDIVDVVTGCGVQLKRAGGTSFKGLCPFHQEKTPSFHVDTARQGFHCFGCGKGGDVFRFFMDKENVDFLNAAQILAARCGVVIPEKSSADPGADAARRSERERLLAVNAEFSGFFCRYLRDNPRSAAAEYLRRRGIPMDVADKFHIGAAPDSWTACRDYGRSQGFSDADMLTAGILRRKEESDRLYDQFRGRLTFTIENEQGKPVGFSARSLEPKPLDGRKYVNTPETPVFRKGQLLYALPQARQGIGRLKHAILCEGQLDAIAFHRAGFDCAVAPLGTAFTPDQARILRRYTRNLILAFDADGAGRKAVLRAAEILLPLSVDLKVLNIPGGKDPDELFAHGGAEAVAEALHHPTPWLDVLRDTLPERFEMDSPVGRGQAAAFVASFLKLVTNQVEVEVYVKEAAAMLGISIPAMQAELSALRNAGPAPRPPAAETPPPPPRAVTRDHTAPALLTLLELALASPDVGRKLSECLPPELIPSSPLGKALSMAISAALNDEMEALPGELQNLMLETPSPEVSKALIRPTRFPPGTHARALDEAVAELRSVRREREQFSLLEQLRSAAGEEEKLRLLTRMQQLNTPAETGN